ncbi:MAG: hypothetical protein HRU18_16730 [Pseudoalteromonas sp.]|uniref:capsid assembly protein n=1 Tax=Pseudoalteromonas sp. TaxID=53249 RepID=UPI001DA05904|nr:hypothetical protein [Pseudoalteromonas sp.]NRA79852.1 hypothetical protein [Pseudoalteromonas sp.]
MKFMNQARLFGMYQEEAGNEDQGGGGGGDESPPADVPPADDNNNPPANDAPEWLMGKYHIEGKSVEEATNEQAKAYKELSGKFGSFTGAPDAYTVELSEGLTEMGIEITAEDPMMVAAMEYAKESNMSQDGFKGLVELYGMQKVAEAQADQEYQAEQMKALGANAGARITNIEEWGAKNLDAETFDALKGMATSVESVKAIEQLISLSRSKPVDIDNAAPAGGSTAEDVAALQFEKDAHGNRRINTDPAFKARYQKMRNEVYGTGEHRQMM